MTIIKLLDLLSINNSIFVNKYFSCNLHPILSHKYILLIDRHSYNTRDACKMVLLTVPMKNNSKHGTEEFSALTISSWNIIFFQSCLPNKILREVFCYCVFINIIVAIIVIVFVIIIIIIIINLIIIITVIIFKTCLCYS